MVVVCRQCWTVQLKHRPTSVGTAEVSTVKSAYLTSAVAPFNNARLYCPYYVGSPEVDRALSMKKTVRFHERFFTSFNIGAGG